jgi:serine/threonine protein kinase
MRRFGPFELEARLGSGGSAEVWRAARHGPHGFARAVALKRLLPERLGDARLKRALLDEARLAATLTHANVAQVLELVEIDGEPAIVMELVEGCELRALLHALAPLGPPAPGLGAFVAHEVCRALAAAHDERPPILHRDVSPTNVLLSLTGAVKLADFGISKALVDDGDRPVTALKGNLGYMAPEQLARAPIGPAADVYSAGVLLWEMLTARRLFPALDLTTTEDVRRRAIPAPSSLNPPVPAALDAICARALAAAPGARFADGGAMAEALAPIAHQLGFGPTQLAELMHAYAPAPGPSALERHTVTGAPAGAPRHTVTVDVATVIDAPRGRGARALLATALAGGALCGAWLALPAPSSPSAPLAAIAPLGRHDEPSPASPVAQPAPAPPLPSPSQRVLFPPPPSPSQQAPSVAEPSVVAPSLEAPAEREPARKHGPRKRGDASLVGGKLVDPFRR